MFFPHLAEIKLVRDEPTIILSKRIELAKRRNAVLAERIVVGDYLKSPKKNKDSTERIRKLIEFDQRFDSTRSFMGIWNNWRYFYFERSPIMPKNKGQLTCIENILDLVKENDMDLNIFVGTVHCAHLKRRFMPGFSTALAYGTDCYEKMYGKVMSDLDRVEYESGALR